MKFALIHLSGESRGKTRFFDQSRITIGRASDNDLVLVGGGGDPVVPQCVELFEEDGHMMVRNQDSDITILINHNPLDAAILQDQDIIQLGSQGPKLRFRVRGEAYAQSKRPPEMLRDALDVSKEAQRAGRGRVRPFVGQLVHEVRRHSTRVTQRILWAILILVVCGIGGVGYYSFSLQQDYQRQLVELSQELEATHRRQSMIGQDRGKSQQPIGEDLTVWQMEFDRRLTILKEQQSETVGVSPDEVRILKNRLKALEMERNHAEGMIRRYGPSVCFVYVAYGLFRNGKPIDGPSFSPEVMGTGFLVDTQGHIVTNRHIVEPWLMNPEVTELVQGGVHPKVFTILAYFPGQAQSYTVSVLKVSPDGDVALGKLSAIPPAVIPIPLAPPSHNVSAGEPVMVLGYPVAVDALLARMDPFVVSKLFQRVNLQLKDLIQSIAELKGIRPLATQGHIGDVVPNRVVYDAPTTGGASGSPVFNSQGEVIAVNATIMRRFEGANSGVPIDLVHDLLAGTRS